MTNIEFEYKKGFKVDFEYCVYTKPKVQIDTWVWKLEVWNIYESLLSESRSRDELQRQERQETKEDEDFHFEYKIQTDASPLQSRLFKEKLLIMIFIVATIVPI